MIMLSQIQVLYHYTQSVVQEFSVPGLCIVLLEFYRHAPRRFISLLRSLTALDEVGLVTHPLQTCMHVGPQVKVLQLGQQVLLHV